MNSSLCLNDRSAKQLEQFSSLHRGFLRLILKVIDLVSLSCGVSERVNAGARVVDASRDRALHPYGGFFAPRLALACGLGHHRESYADVYPSRDLSLFPGPSRDPCRGNALSCLTRT